MLYHVRVASAADLGSAAARRVKVGDTVQITCLAWLGARCAEIRSGNGELAVQDFSIIEPHRNAQLSIDCRVSGPLRIAVRGAAGRELGALNFCVGSTLRASATELSVITVISQRLGPLRRWPAALQAVQRQRFNAIHFTPLQRLGGSRSSYSIADFLELSAAFDGSWADVIAKTAELRRSAGIASLGDIVLNHVAHDSPYLAAHPEFGFNEVNSPWLRGAIALDDLFKRFTQDLVAGRARAAEGRALRASVDSAADVEALVQCFEAQYLQDGFSHRAWFTMDVDASVRAYREFVADARQVGGTVPGADVPLAAIVDGASTYTDAVRRLVGEAPNFAARGDILAHYASSERHARDLIAWAQQAMWDEGSRARRDTLDALRGTLRYERLEQKKGPVTFEPWNSVVPWYFTPVTAASSAGASYEAGRVYSLANNGWVMGWAGPRGFIERGSNVYLKRSLVAWSDCVKLRYGEPRAEQYADCPALWDLVREYAELSARVFDGFRLDNCHTTPAAVASFVLEAARAVRPNLFVFAELFTGDEAADVAFEETLGLDALVREAIQTSSPGDEAWHALKYSVERRTFAQLEPNADLGLSARRPVTARAANIFYDCTHDNETCVQKNRPSDVLATAALVTASGCAVGSTLGYEVLVRKNPSVLADGDLYPDVHVAAAAAAALPAAPAGQTLVLYRVPPGAAAPRSVEVWGEHNGWASGVPLERHGEIWYVCLETATLGAGKFVLDGREWLCSADYATVLDARGNQNNDLRAPRDSSPDLGRSAGIIEARRVLNAIHGELSEYPEISVAHLADDLVSISRYRPRDGAAYHFIIRSGWWVGNPAPARSRIPLSGKLESLALSCCINSAVLSSAPPEAWALASTQSVLAPLPREPSTWYDGESDTTWLELGDKFPSGSVCIYRTIVDRADTAIEALLEPASITEALTTEEINLILWSCDTEERDRSLGARGLYSFPEIREVAYAGVMGVIDAMRATREQFPDDYQLHGIYQNVTLGDWLIDYHFARVQSFLGADHALTRTVGAARDILHRCRRRETKARAIERLFTWLLSQCQKALATRVAIDNRDLSVQGLILAATQFIGCVNSARLNERTPVSLAAGLPHFSTEYTREWGRDTMLSLVGLCAPLGRWDFIRLSIISYAQVLRHGLIPNLLDSSNSPRYNARDAVHFWLNAIQRYVRFAPPELGRRLLDEPITLKFPPSLPYEIPMLQSAGAGAAGVRLKDCIRYVLYAHFHGIKFREWNAGFRIDSRMTDEGFDVEIRRDGLTGFCVGGNRWNCGTWMDMMGSSEKAGNKGEPATPRDGAPVELTMALYSTLCWVLDDAAEIGLTSSEVRDYSAWRAQIKASFLAQYSVTAADAARFPHCAVAGTFKDTVGCAVEEEDFYCRCNYSIGLGLSLHHDFAPKCVNLRALLIAFAELVDEPNQVGMKTLNARNPRYRGFYDNGNDSADKSVAHGFSYHQGPEWVWPLGYWCEAFWRALGSGVCDGDCGADAHVSQAEVDAVQVKLANILHNIATRLWSGPWYSLPEITNADGQYCRDGCQAQAWSVASFLSWIWQAEAPAAAGPAAAPAPAADQENEAALNDSMIAEPATSSATATKPVESSPELPRAADFVELEEDPREYSSPIAATEEAA